MNLPDFQMPLPAGILAAAQANAVSPQAAYITLGVTVMAVLFRMRQNPRSKAETREMILGAVGSLAMVSGLFLLSGAPLVLRYALVLVGFMTGITLLALRTWEKSQQQMLKQLGMLVLAGGIFFATFYNRPYSLHDSLNLKLVLLASFVVSFCVTAILTIWKQRVAQANLAGLAARLGWQLEAQPHLGGLVQTPILTGEHRRRRLRLADYQPPRSAANTGWVALEATLSTDSGLHLTLTPRPRQTTGLAAATDADEAFEQLFEIEPKDAGLAKKIFAPGLRQRVVKLFRESGGLFLLGIRDRQAVYAIPGHYASADCLNRLAENVGLVCDFADAAEQYRA